MVQLFGNLLFCFSFFFFTKWLSWKNVVLCILLHYNFCMRRVQHFSMLLLLSDVHQSSGPGKNGGLLFLIFFNFAPYLGGYESTRIDFLAENLRPSDWNRWFLSLPICSVLPGGLSFTHQIVCTGKPRFGSSMNQVSTLTIMEMVYHQWRVLTLCRWVTTSGLPL